ncbi:MAG: hypothetical protein U1D96_08340 [Eubacteriales bacterium]|nr:hypothetical protein [Bacillota bacterium]MBV1728505.1 hypothetical protein [Desulforudis sp.]MDQ7789300.1 hypothetical protein [Clostridia bacterium]MDZ4043485.1 hypothetical protein [Eubacteriales bacterium]MBU4533095.1 hypothetical protein [Bacillota bacterium]
MRIWLDPPTAPQSMSELTGAFQEFFGYPWARVMMDAFLPFSHHAGWDAYLAVAGLCPVSALYLPDLMPSAAHDSRPLNLIVG